jgi:hypothetical protein
VTALIDDAIKRSHDQYASMTPFEFAGLKQTLCRFFANKRVKVSLFLQDGIQKNDGTITLKYDGLLPPGVERPGKIQYVDVSGAPLGACTPTAPCGRRALVGDARCATRTPSGSDPAATLSPVARLPQAPTRSCIRAAAG